MLKSWKSVKDVKEVVKSVLAEPDIDFELFKSPPKQILKSEDTLLDSDCIPSANIYFKSSKTNPNNSYLNQNVIANLSNFTGAMKLFDEAIKKQRKS